MPTTPLYPCSKCKKEFNFDNVKYDSEKKLVCKQCFEKIESIKKKELPKEMPDANEPIHFLCLECKYKFSIKKGSQQNLKCPYCGRTRLMHVKKYKDENDLINESTSSKYDF